MFSVFSHTYAAVAFTQVFNAKGDLIHLHFLQPLPGMFGKNEPYPFFFTFFGLWNSQTHPRTLGK